MNKTDNQLEPWLSRVKQKLDSPTPASPIPSDEGWLRLEEELFATPIATQRTYHLGGWLSTAAVILALLVGGTFFLHRQTKQNNPAPKEELVAQHPSRESVSKPDAKIEHFSVKEEKPKLTERKTGVNLKKKTSARKKFTPEKHPSQLDAKAEQKTMEPSKKKETPSIPEPSINEKEILLIPYPDKNPCEPMTGYPDITDNTPLELKSQQSEWSIKMNISNSGSMPLNSESDRNSILSSDISLKSMQLKSMQVKNFDEEYAESSFSHRLPLNIGIKISHRLSDRFSLESGLVYTYLSSQVSPRDTDKTLTQRVHYIGLPIGINYSILGNRNLDIYAGVGGRVDKCISAALDDRFLRMNPLQFSAGGRIGLNYKLSRHVGFYLEPGVSYFFNDGSALKTTYKENPLKVTLSMGFCLSY